MKILFSSYPFSPSVGGIETVSALLAPEFVRAGHELILVTRTKDEDGVPRPYAVERRPGVRKLVELVCWCDVYLQNNISLELGWPLFFVRRPWIIAHHTWIGHSTRGGAWKAALKRGLLRRATHAAISGAVAARLPVAATVTGNPYDDRIFRERPEIARDRELVFVGRLVSDKGADLLLCALALLRERGLRPRLTLIGAGPEEPNLRRLADELHLRDQIEFAGSLAPEALAMALNRHRILVVPSRWEEPFGIVALEGIASGCVVVAAKSGGLAEATGPCGLSFPIGDTAALADALARLLESPGEMARLRQGAAEHLGRFLPARVAARYLEILEKSRT